MSTWEDARRILVRIYALMEEAGSDYVTGAVIAAALGVESDDDVQGLLRDLQNLQSYNYIRLHVDGYGQLPSMVHATAEGRRRVLDWPTG